MAASFLDIALRNAARGFRVHPLRGKDAFLHDWPNVATTDEETLRAWAARFPDYNVGIAAGPIIAIVDSDRVSRLKELSGEHAEWFNTYSVSSGRPDRAHFYYLMTDEARDFGNKKWAEPGINGNVFEMKVHGGQVVAEGSVHPDTGQEYRIVQDLPLIPFPAGLLTLMREYYGKSSSAQRERVPREKIGEGGRHDALVCEAGRVLRVTEMSKPVLTAHLQDFNEQWIEPPLDSEEVERIALSCNWTPEPPTAIATIGGSKPVTDWRLRYHTFDEMENAPKPAFLIEGFLQKDVIAAIAAPVGQRKTLIAANVTHALLTGEPLFDHFSVTQRPTRVLHLCPEMGLISFADRLRKLDILEYAGKTLFCRTMNSEGKLTLCELTTDELEGAVLIVDTAVRFIQGDENSSEDMRVLAEDCFRIMKMGAASVLVLFHSPKGTKDISELTLENAMRGSGELGAFVSSCWATRLQNPEEPYQSASYIVNVKQRDFESKPFEVTSGPDCRLHIVSPPDSNVKLNSKKAGPKGNLDGKEAEALQIIRDNLNLTIPKIVLKLAEHGIERCASWVGNKRREITGTGVETGHR